jgi:threonine/homoserine/homoserine lactone efflux protein
MIRNRLRGPRVYLGRVQAHRLRRACRRGDVVDPAALTAYLLAVMALIWLPGPDWAFMLAVGSRERRAVPAAGGLAVGYVVMTLAVAAGVAPLVAAAPAALVVIAVAGAGYLVYLGVGILRSSGRAHTAVPADPLQDAAPATSSAKRLLLRGIGVSALNPKSLVLFVAFLPQFVRPAAPWPVAVQLAVLGLLWAAIGAAFYTALGFTAQKALGTRPALAGSLGRVTGVAMVVGGVALAGEQLLHTLR